MKTIRSFTKSPLTIAVLLIAFLNLSCNQDDFVKPYVDNTINSKQYSDIDIFKGVIFLEGPVAKKLNKFNELNFRNYAKSESDVNKMIVFQNELTSYIQKSNPDYFSEFRENIGSGDYYMVQEALNNAVLMIKSKSIEMLGLNENEVKNDIERLQLSVTKKISNTQNVSKLSKEEVFSIIKDLGSDYNKSKSGSPVGIDLWILVYGAVVIAAAAVLVVFLVQPPESTTIGNETYKNNFYIEDFQSEITLQLEGI